MTTVRIGVAVALDRLGLLGAILESRVRGAGPAQAPAPVRLPVLTFHRLAAVPEAAGLDPDVVDTTPDRLERHVALLQRYFTLVDTRDLVAARAGRPLPPRPALLSFDDGYRDNHDLALPVLRRRGAKAVFFVATGYVAARRLFWWDRVAVLLARTRRERLELAYPEARSLDVDGAAARRAARRILLDVIKRRRGLDLDRFLDEIARAAGVRLDRDEERALAEEHVMGWAEVRALADAGMDVQSHTRWHRVLGTLNEAGVAAELEGARDDLREAVGLSAEALAYPAGGSPAGAPGLRHLVRRAGHRIAFGYGGGVARLGRGTDWLEIPRLRLDADTPDAYLRGVLALSALAA